MKPHKWAKEIKAWADGAEIEEAKIRAKSSAGSDISVVEKIWEPAPNPAWNPYFEYRIKPQPKEPTYLYVYADSYYDPIEEKNAMAGTRVMNKPIKEWECNYIGKIKLESDDD